MKEPSSGDYLDQKDQQGSLDSDEGSYDHSHTSDDIIHPGHQEY